MTQEQATIYVVDDDDSFRSAITRLLTACGYRTEAFAAAADLLESSLRAPGCILLDLHMPGLNGRDVQDRLSDAGCILPIVFVTGDGTIPVCVDAVKAGAEDFLVKPVPRDALMAAVERAIALSNTALALQENLSVARSRVAALTGREQQVLALVVKGKMNKQIAWTLGLSERTIKIHRHAVMQKLEVRSIVELISLVDRLGLRPQLDSSAMPS